MEIHETFISYPSLIANLLDNRFVEAEANKIQFRIGATGWAIGDLVRDQQLPSAKPVNLTITEQEFELLVISAAQATQSAGSISLVLGFPHLTFDTNRRNASSFNGRTFHWETPEGPKRITVDQVFSIPESIGHAVGVRHLLQLKRRVVCLSIGFGTIESVILQPDGRPIVSTVDGAASGIRMAVKDFRARIIREFAIREPVSVAGNDQLWDEWLRLCYHNSESMPNIIGSEGAVPHADLHRIALDAICHYSEKIVRPAIRKLLSDNETTDADFCMPGGGSLFKEPVKVAREMCAQNYIPFVEVDDKYKMITAVIGYEQIIEQAFSNPGRYLIADFGNAFSQTKSITLGIN